MKELTYKCDTCGRMCDPANHWFSVNVSAARKNLTELAIAAGTQRDYEEHYCGQECILKMVARNLPK